VFIYILFYILSKCSKKETSLIIFYAVNQNINELNQLVYLKPNPRIFTILSRYFSDVGERFASFVTCVTRLAGANIHTLFLSNQTLQTKKQRKCKKNINDFKNNYLQLKRFVQIFR